MSDIAATPLPQAPPLAEGPSATKWPVVLAVVLSAVLEVLDSTIVNVALPHIKTSFGATNDQITWILTSYIVAAVIVMPLTGYFSLRFGRRNLIVTAISGFAVSSALCGLAWSLEAMVAFRLSQGVFGAFLIPLSQSILFDVFPKEKRGQAMAIFGLGVVVAPVLGPTFGAFLTEYFSWRMVFYVNIPVASFALIMILGELPKDEKKAVRTDWAGLGLLATAIGALQLILDQGESRDWFASRVIQVAAVCAVVAGIAFLVRGLRRSDNIIDLTLFRDRNFLAANIAMMAFGISMFGAIALIPLFVQGLLDYPVIDAGYLFVPRGIAAGLSMIIVGAVLLKRFDPRLLVAIGLILTGTGNLMLGWLNLDAGFWQIAVPGIVAGAGMGLFFVPMSTVAFDTISREKQDEASGLYSVTRSLGSSIGIAIVGWQLVNRTQLHWANLSSHVTPYSPQATAYLAPLGLDPNSPQGAAVLTAEIARQAQMLAYSELFWMLGWTAFAMLPIVLLMKKPQQAAGAAPVH